METGTHNPRSTDVASTCRVNDGVEALVSGHTYQKATGDGRHWLLLNLPNRSSVTLYLGCNEDVANEIHAATLKAVTEAIRYERNRCVQTVREEAQRKLTQAREDDAPPTYTAAIEGTAVDIELSLNEGRIVLG